jgi:CysZ protein
VIADLLRGAGYLLGGFGLWRRRPALMALALVPALLVFLVMAALLVGLGSWLVGVVPEWTAFADAWPEWGATSLRFLLSVALVAALGLVLLLSYTSVTLAVGDPLYGRISRAADDLDGAAAADRPPGRSTWLADTLALLGAGASTGLAAGLVGLVPGVGAVLAAAGGFIAAGWLQAVGLTAGALERRGLDRRARAAVLRSRRWRVLGFGLVAQALFLAPLGAVVVMPAAAAGAARLARELVAGRRSDPVG